ncbi:unannotated protein [freshwater metagenome]|uniref:Unannotated protein n=1 Tax=freshwater metagenome TaxID=449393 RepID=A0A6J6TMD9_9ZZZZ
MSTAVVFIGGHPPHPGVLAHLPQDRWVVAADSGYDHATALGVEVDLLVGDMDSVSLDGLLDAAGHGVTIERFPTDKDFTDTELALRAALRHGPSAMVVVSCVGDRLDHSISALMALADPSLAAIPVEAWWGEAHVTVLRGPAARVIGGSVGETVSLLPVDGPAEGVTTTGLLYALHNEVLHATASRGVSNVFTEPSLTIEVRHGALLVIRPHALRSATAAATPEEPRT